MRGKTGRDRASDLAAADDGKRCFSGGRFMLKSLIRMGGGSEEGGAVIGLGERQADLF